MKLVKVNLLNRNLNQSFTYEIDSFLNYKTYDIVIVEFSNKLELAIISDVDSQEVTYTVKKIIKLFPQKENSKYINDLMQYFKSKKIISYQDAYKLIIDRNKTFHHSFKILYQENEISLKEFEKNSDEIIDMFSKNEIDFILSKPNKLSKTIYSLDNINYLKKENILNNDISEYKFNKMRKSNEIKSKKITNYEYTTLKNKKEKYELEKEQIDVSQEILESSKISLLKGITGSGKSYVYLDLIEKTLLDGKKVLLLVPEKLLAIKMYNFINKYIEEKSYYYFDLDKKDKISFLNLINKKEAMVIVGLRSSIFLDINNLGLVIVDEEHDSSYKQDFYPYYHVSDLYDFWKNKKIKIVLGSATPSLRSYAKSYVSQYDFFELKTRYSNFNLPDILICEDDTKFISDLQDVILENENALILYNTKGYSNRIRCLDCNEGYFCPNCNIALKYYKDKKILKCNYCDYKINFHKICLHCSSPKIEHIGEGIEQVEEKLCKVFNNKVHRIDSEVNKKKINFILDKFNKTQGEILLGTQIISKGLDFNKLRHVFILNLDAMLTYSDFNVGEQTYQLLEQMSGRSGRDIGNSKVHIYTKEKNHYIYKAVVEHDYELFFKNEMANRKLQKINPYYNVAMIELRAQKIQLVSNEMNEIEQILKNQKLNTTSILTPYLEKINNKYRQKIFIKYKNENIKEIVEKNILSKSFKSEIYVDVNIESYGY